MGETLRMSPHQSMRWLMEDYLQRKGSTPLIDCLYVRRLVCRINGEMVEKGSVGGV
jgi:hypothetical protein